MKKSRLLGIICTCIITCVPTIATSALVSKDWKAPSDGLITLDTISNLEWLDLTESTNVSYNSMLGEFSASGQFEDFRYATQAEILDLWVNSGFSATSDYVFGDVPGNASSSSFLSYFGIIETTIEPQLTTYNSHGMYDWSDTSLSGPPIAFVAFRDSFNPSYRATIDDGPWDTTTAGAWLGSWLVRDATVVPIPAAAWLFGSGLLGLVGIARK